MNKLKYPFLCLALTISLIGCAQKTADSLKYLAQKPPSLTPEVFATHFISKEGRSEFGSVFSKDGMEFFFGIDGNTGSEIQYSKLENGFWTQPKTVISHDIYSYNDPFLSPDEQELYYISDQPLDRKGGKKDHDIWYSKKEGKGWSLPINAGKHINSEGNEYYMSFTSDGTMYFSSNEASAKNRSHDFDIYAAKRHEDRFQKAVKLDDSINSGDYEADVFISPDESYLIFCAVRKEGLGQGDLYISFKNSDGSWTNSKNMGAPINTKGHELCPFVSQDGNYFFYTSNQDIYWVDAKIIDTLRSPEKP